MINLKCIKCGNEEYFYTKEKVVNNIHIVRDNKGNFAEKGENIGRHDDDDYTLASVYYYCANCDAKVQKISKDKRY